MSLLLFKIPLLLYTVYLNGASTPSSFKSLQGWSPSHIEGLSSSGFVVFPTIMTLAYWATVACESAVIIARTCPSYALSMNIQSTLSSSAGSPVSTYRIGITLAFIAGWLLVYAGSMLHARCHQHFGASTAPQVTNQRELVTTGPYAVIRNLISVGTIMVLIGTTIIELGSGSWMAHIGNSAYGRVFAISVLGAQWVMVLTEIARASWEDASLQKHFGIQWDEWARRTPYKLLLGIY